MAVEVGMWISGGATGVVGLVLGWCCACIIVVHPQPWVCYYASAEDASADDNLPQAISTNPRRPMLYQYVQ